MLIPILAIITGFILLVWSADQLVEYASRLAINLGVSNLLIGILIIGFGTSAPELFVSALAAWQDKGNLALGNALGSNITNIGLVLGSAACVATLAISKSTARTDIPAVIAVALIAVAVILDGHLSRTDGVILLLVLAGYLIWSVVKERTSDEELPDERSSNSVALAWTIASIVILVIASRILVYGSVEIATYLGVSELIIGLTIIAIGTSLPELAAAIAAARKNVHDMIIGNIVGSNIFNTLGVLGITGVVRATEINQAALWRDFPVMLAITLLLLVIALSKQSVSRTSGVILLSCYVSYICYLAYSTLI
jgi:cation:H+ antiporter